jgi:protein-tyrosine phosphatase
MDICRDSDGDTHKMNAYPDGPVCVLAPYLFLYSEPTLKQVEEFDIVVNVAKELSPPILKSSVQLDTSSLQHYKHKSTEYFYVPWTHTSKLGPDLPLLTQLILDSLQKKKKVLVHCQCGVSRSASLIVACLMKLHCVPLNDAYNMLKERAPDISPNMSLIFQLMEWGEFLGVNPRPEPGYSPIELGMDPLSFEGNKMLS